MAAPKKYFLVHLTEVTTGFDRGFPLNHEPKTLADCRNMLAWQAKGGFSTDGYAIATATAPVPGVMEYTPKNSPVKTPRPILIEQGPRTKEAFRDMVMNIWGDF